MLMVQDTSYGEARGLHSKWQKHQAFMAELASNQGWLEKIETVGASTGAWKTHCPPQAGREVPMLVWSRAMVATNLLGVAGRRGRSWRAASRSTARW